MQTSTQFSCNAWGSDMHTARPVVVSTRQRSFGGFFIISLILLVVLVLISLLPTGSGG